MFTSVLVCLLARFSLACLLACSHAGPFLVVRELACLLVGSLARTLAYKLAVRLVAGLPVCDLVTYLNMIKGRRIPKHIQT